MLSLQQRREAISCLCSFGMKLVALLFVSVIVGTGEADDCYSCSYNTLHGTDTEKCLSPSADTPKAPCDGNCHTTSTAISVTRHCAEKYKCTGDCCMGNLCNGDSASSIPDGNLICYSCSYKSSKKVDLNKCLQPRLIETSVVPCSGLCYSTRTLTSVTRGCTATCPSTLQCCTHSYCNNKPVTISSAKLLCYSCGYSVQSGEDTDKCMNPLVDNTPAILCKGTCYLSVTATNVIRGCSMSCTSNHQSCCSDTNYCNSETIIIAQPMTTCSEPTCFSCKYFKGSEDDETCEAPIQGKTPTTTCSGKCSVTVDHDLGEITRECSVHCVARRILTTRTVCCNENHCNTSSSLRLSFSLALLLASLIAVGCILS